MAGLAPIGELKSVVHAFRVAPRGRAASDKLAPLFACALSADTRNACRNSHAPRVSSRNGRPRTVVERFHPSEVRMPYITAVVIPVPKANLDTYKRMSEEWGRAHLRQGALYYSDAISDDVQPGKATSFPQAVELKDDEVIALAWVVYKSKEDRERIEKAVMEDPALKESMDPSNMPFDGKRMFWGGFETIVGLAPGH
jgi:uncharacterized protein YbaA (DUF1428 family)